MRHLAMPSWMRDETEPWTQAETLPVVGEAHPLKRRYRVIMMRAAVTAALVHMTLFTAFYIVELERNREPVALPVRLVNLTDFPQPPPIQPDVKPPAMSEIIQKTPPPIGAPNPVDDYRALVPTIMPNRDMEPALVGPDIGDPHDGRDSLVVTIPAAASGGNPTPDEFVAYEEAPGLINLPPPVYPEMARQAEVEGTVTVRVLVGKDGKVADAIVSNGIPMLNDAALAAARRAVFRPALQQHRPVAVWVEIPMAFGLR